MSCRVSESSEGGYGNQKLRQTAAFRRPAGDVMHCWNVAQKDTALRYSLNTRMTHEAAYNRYRHELENIGIDSAAAFRRIIHSTHSLERHLQNPANSGGAASPLPAIRHHTGNEDVAPPGFCKCLYSLSRCFCSAIEAASARVATPSLEKITVRCFLTLTGDIPNWTAIS